MIIILLLIVGIFASIQLYANNKSQRISGTPTVFVHGYKGTYNSFANMLKRLEYNQKLGEKILTYHVFENGEIQIADADLKIEEPAYIQVVFENSRANFEDSAKWLSFVLNDLKTNYHVDRANLVGHSMGGIVSFKYIQEYQNEKEFPIIEKLVTLGSPFDGIYNEEYFRYNQDAAAVDLKPDSPALNILRKNKQSFPENIKVLVIGSTGDLIARPESVKAITSMMSTNTIKKMIIENKELGHSALHENENIDLLIYDFLYSKNNEESGKTTDNNLQ